MHKKILITGSSGFAGSHLVDYLLSKNTHSITGTYLSDKSVVNLPKSQRLKLMKVDFTRKEEVLKLITLVRPGFIFHLAALSSPADSYSMPVETFMNNVVAEVNLLEAVRNTIGMSCRVLIVSSGDIYGKVEEKDLPIDEETPLKPTNPYAVSKLAQDFFALQYFLSYKLCIIRVRPFNHIGPRQSPGFVVAAFAKKIAEIEKGIRAPVMHVGNLEAKRDFTDVRDIVKAYHAILENGAVGHVYNIGSGKSCSIQSILEQLLSLSKTKIEVVIDKNLFRPGDEAELLCDSTKLRKTISWKPTMPLEQSLKDTLDYWRNIV